MLRSYLKDCIYTLRRYVPSPRDAAVILMYHSIGDNGKFFTVSANDFERQMRYLHDNQFNVVSLDTLAGYREAGVIPQKTVAITFDDGYRDNLTAAFPVLKRYGLPATIFIIIGVHDGSFDAAGSLPMLSSHDLVELHASGLIAIEPHSVTHPKFTKLPADEARSEVSGSKKFLENLLHKECLHFAYPKGAYNDAAKHAVSASGISYAYTVESGCVTPGSDAYALPRNSIDSAVSFTQFRGIVCRGRLR